MPDDKSPLETLQDRIDKLPAPPSGLLELGRAMAGRLDPGKKQDCSAYQGSLPDYVEAELNGQRVRRLFPSLALHLDLCSECGQIYMDLLETALQVEAEPLPVLTPVPQFDLAFLPRLTFAEHMRQVVEMFAEGLLRQFVADAVADLASTSRLFFQWLREAGADFRPQSRPEFALAFGSDLPPALQSLALAYSATNRLLDALSAEDLAAELSGARPPRTLHRQARSAARNAGLRGKEAGLWAQRYVTLAQAHSAEFLELARRTARDEQSD